MSGIQRSLRNPFCFSEFSVFLSFLFNYNSEFDGVFPHKTRLTRGVRSELIRNDGVSLQSINNIPMAINYQRDR